MQDKRFGIGEVAMTSRLAMEIQGVKYEKITESEVVKKVFNVRVVAVEVNDTK